MVKMRDILYTVFDHPDCTHPLDIGSKIEVNPCIDDSELVIMCAVDNWRDVEPSNEISTRYFKIVDPAKGVGDWLIGYFKAEKHKLDSKIINCGEHFRGVDATKMTLQVSGEYGIFMDNRTVNRCMFRSKFSFNHESAALLPIQCAMDFVHHTRHSGPKGKYFVKINWYETTTGQEWYQLAELNIDPDGHEIVEVTQYIFKGNGVRDVDQLSEDEVETIFGVVPLHPTEPKHYQYSVFNKRGAMLIQAPIIIANFKVPRFKTIADHYLEKQEHKGFIDHTVMRVFELYDTEQNPAPLVDVFRYTFHWDKMGNPTMKMDNNFNREQWKSPDIDPDVESFARVPYTFDELSKLTPDELKEVEKVKLAEFCEAENARFALVANIMYLQTKIDEGKI
jgi:hypothetical protein